MTKYGLNKSTYRKYNYTWQIINWLTKETIHQSYVIYNTEHSTNLALDGQQEGYNGEQPGYDDTYDAIAYDEQQETAAPAASAGGGPSAKTLYDYQAGMTLIEYKD